MLPQPSSPLQDVDRERPSAIRYSGCMRHMRTALLILVLLPAVLGLLPARVQAGALTGAYQLAPPAAAEAGGAQGEAARHTPGQATVTAGRRRRSWSPSPPSPASWVASTSPWAIRRACSPPTTSPTAPPGATA